MKTRELPMLEKYGILKLRKGGNLIRTHHISEGCSQYNNLEHPEKERYHWCTNNQTSNSLAKEYNSSW